MVVHPSIRKIKWLFGEMFFGAVPVLDTFSLLGNASFWVSLPTNRQRTSLSDCSFMLAHSDPWPDGGTGKFFCFTCSRINAEELIYSWKLSAPKRCSKMYVLWQQFMTSGRSWDALAQHVSQWRAYHHGNPMVKTPSCTSATSALRWSQHQWLQLCLWADQCTRWTTSGGEWHRDLRDGVHLLRSKTKCTWKSYQTWRLALRIT